jgi:hypothetical protein
MEDMKTSWRTSTYTGNGGGNCVEVANDTSRVLVRDTKDRDGGTLAFTVGAWRRLTDAIKRSLADRRVRLTPGKGATRLSGGWPFRKDRGLDEGILHCAGCVRYLRLLTFA